MIKTKNIVMLILSTILTINIMTISAFAVEVPTSEYINYIPSDSSLSFSSIDDVYNSVSFDFFPYTVYLSSNSSHYNMENIENWFVAHSNINQIVFYVMNKSGDISINSYFYDVNEVSVSFDGMNIIMNNSTSDTVNFVRTDLLLTKSDSGYSITFSYRAYTSLGSLTTTTYKYPNNTNYTPLKLISSNEDIYDTSGNLVVNSSTPKEKINFEVKINSALDWFQVIATVDENVTQFDDYYTWGIEPTDKTELLYVHDVFFSTYEKNGEIFKTKSKTHFLTYQTPMISTVLLETLYGGDSPILTFGTDYKVSLMRYSIGADGGVEYYPLKEYSATINIQSFNDYEIEYSGNAELDINGEIYFNYQGYNGIYSDTDVNFDNAINDFENITEAEWSPNLMSGLTVVRGLFDDIIDSLGLVDIIMIILTLGLVGWFLGRKMRG